MNLTSFGYSLLECETLNTFGTFILSNSTSIITIFKNYKTDDRYDYEDIFEELQSSPLGNEILNTKTLPDAAFGLLSFFAYVFYREEMCPSLNDIISLIKDDNCF